MGFDPAIAPEFLTKPSCPRASVSYQFNRTEAFAPHGLLIGGILVNNPVSHPELTGDSRKNWSSCSLPIKLNLNYPFLRGWYFSANPIYGLTPTSRKVNLTPWTDFSHRWSRAHCPDLHQFWLICSPFCR